MGLFYVKLMLPFGQLLEKTWLLFTPTSGHTVDAQYPHVLVGVHVCVLGIHPHVAINKSAPHVAPKFENWSSET